MNVCFSLISFFFCVALTLGIDKILENDPDKKWRIRAVLGWAGDCLEISATHHNVNMPSLQRIVQTTAATQCLGWRPFHNNMSILHCVSAKAQGVQWDQLYAQLSMSLVTSTPIGHFCCQEFGVVIILRAANECTTNKVVSSHRSVVLSESTCLLDHLLSTRFAQQFILSML